ncbi:MAG: hypothetical protein ACP5NS_04670 [Candidatus Pacearchaeota archaeon]
MSKTISIIEIYLIVMMSVSFAYLVAQTNDLTTQLPITPESKFISKMRVFVLDHLSNGIVSAQTPALWTCQTSLNGTACQEYPSNVCNSLCTNSCFPGLRADFSACNLGTCYDPTFGTCLAGSPQFLCQQSGGQWSAQQPAQCNRECCLINPTGNGGAGDAQFTTQQQCNYLGQTLGAPVSFVPVEGEVECLLKASSQTRGACVLEFLPDLQKYNCETTTQSDCIVSGGEFYEEQLCTNPSLNTKCEVTQNTKCFDSLDGVYYIDSCNNRANIYDSAKLNDISYWSNIVSEANSCLAGATGTAINNQASCGNCNYLLGSICGNPKNGVDQNAIYGNYVCKDLSCTDEWGNERQNGESWCAYDGKIGVDGSPSAPLSAINPIFAGLPIQQGQTWCITNGIATVYTPPSILSPNVTITQQPVNIPQNAFTPGTICSNDTSVGGVNTRGTNEERSVDLPGSRHYRKVCFDGEVRTEPCAEGRGEICAQSVQSSGYTTASCRINTWQQCLASNDSPEKLNKCEENPDCFLKHVEIDSFKFDICTPQYPPALYSADDTANDDETICSYASQSCTYIEKKTFTGWRCILNCGCKDKQFTETMNNLCSSLGDCGGKINLNGDFTHDGYSVRGRAPKLGASYISGMQSYNTPIEGQSATVLNNSQLAAIYGVPESTFEPSSIHSTLALLGIGAVGLYYAGSIAYLLGIGGETAVAAAYAAGGGVPTAAQASAISIAEGNGATMASFSTALSGAAVGAAIGYIIGSIFGLDGTAMTIAMVAGAALGLAGGLGAFGPGVVTFLTNPITIIVIVVIIVIMMVLGIGKTRERSVGFQCLPWQPPVGGAKCDLCNSDDLSCTKYKCETFGKTCRYLNEGTGNEVCVNIAPNDVSPPQIDVSNDALSSGFNYNNPQTNIGVTIKNVSVNDGCLQEYSQVNWGIILNEPGQCKVSETHTSSYEEMESYFSNTVANQFATNHTTATAMPTLDELGVSGVDPARRGNYKLFVRCQDASGNYNTAEYVAEFCVSPANDVTPPSITQFVPASPGLVGLNATGKQVQFYTNEPATCRWSTTSGQDYSQMINSAQCTNDINQVTLNGWACTVNLPVLNASTSSYYFRCADQPWLGNNETNPNLPDPNQNVNSADSVYQIQKTVTPLSITSITPNGNTISVGSLPVSVNLGATTAGGINNGNAYCSYNLNGGGYIPFFNTGSNTHVQTFSSLFDGTYSLGLQCVDLAQNIATGSTQFSIQVDSSGPLITRIYSSGSALTVITNEDSTCAWSTESCSFDFATGTLLSGSSHVHTMPYENGINYRIKCKDTFGNIGTCLTASGGY